MPAACLFRVSVFLLFSVAVRSQQCGESDCTRECLPLQWQRNLCNFYEELEEWRSTVLQCGLSVPAFNRDNTLPAEEQWQEARQQWNMVRETWEEAARENGVISDGDTMPVTDSRPLEEVWQEELQEWLDHYGNWRESVSEQGPPLGPTPQYSISGTGWLQVFADWTQDFGYYNATYYDTC